MLSKGSYGPYTSSYLLTCSNSFFVKLGNSKIVGILSSIEELGEDILTEMEQHWKPDGIGGSLQEFMSKNIISMCCRMT